MSLYSLGFDIGSSSVKGALVNLNTNAVMAIAKFPEKELEINSPQPGWAEQDPELWWNCVEKVFRLLLKSSGVNATEISCIGISYQMHGLVAVDKMGNLVRKSIIWCDSRAVVSGDFLKAKLKSSYINQHLYNSPANFTASKLFWVKEYEPETFNRISKIMLPGDYIAYKLSGDYTTSISGLSEGILWDFKNNSIAHELIDAMGISDKLIPAAHSSFDIASSTSSEIESAWGIKKGTPISYRAGDQPNNAMSLGVISPGQAAGTGGTSGVVYALSKEIKKDPSDRVNSFAHVNHSEKNPCIGTLLCINGTGIMYNWVRTQFYPNKSYTELEVIMNEVSPGADNLFLFPFGNGTERMLNNSPLGASMQGIDFNRHGAPQITRAAIEGIAFSFNYGIQILRQLGIPCSSFRVGNDNLFQSRIFAESLATISESEIKIFNTTGAVGAAQGAGFGAGYFSSLEEATNSITLVGTYHPIKNLVNLKESYSKWESRLKYQLL